MPVGKLVRKAVTAAVKKVRRKGRPLSGEPDLPEFKSPRTGGSRTAPPGSPPKKKPGGMTTGETIRRTDEAKRQYGDRLAEAKRQYGKRKGSPKDYDWKKPVPTPTYGRPGRKKPVPTPRYSSRRALAEAAAAAAAGLAGAGGIVALSERQKDKKRAATPPRGRVLTAEEQRKAAAWRKKNREQLADYNARTASPQVKQRAERDRQRRQRNRTAGSRSDRRSGRSR